MGNFILSLVLGMLPEVLFFTTFLIFVKDIKIKKFKLFVLICIAYILCIMISRFILLYYVGFIVLVYLILKLLYKDKTQIIDIFVFSIATIYTSFLCIIMYSLVNNNYLNYYLLYILDRICLIIPLIFKSKLNLFYKKYCSLWNRNYEKKQPIKSITLRNISLIVINIFIFILNIATLSCINLFK